MMWWVLSRGALLTATLTAAAFGYFTKPWQYPGNLPGAVCTGNVVGALRRLHGGDQPDAAVSGWPYDGKAMFLAIDNTGCGKPMAFGLVDLLHLYGADANASTTSGYTLLMLAASEGNASVARKLILWGAHVNQRDKTGRTALMYASEVGHHAIVRLLLENGAEASVGNIANMTASDLAGKPEDDDLAR